MWRNILACWVIQINLETIPCCAGKKELGTNLPMELRPTNIGGRLLCRCCSWPLSFDKNRWSLTGGTKGHPFVVRPVSRQLLRLGSILGSTWAHFDIISPVSDTSQSIGAYQKPQTKTLVGQYTGHSTTSWLKPYRSGAAEGQSCMFGSSVTGSLDPQWHLQNKFKAKTTLQSTKDLEYSTGQKHNKHTLTHLATHDFLYV